MTAVMWNDNRTAALRDLWENTTKTASEIAAELGGFEGCRDGGRSSVLGKVDRMKLKPRRTRCEDVALIKRRQEIHAEKTAERQRERRAHAAGRTLLAPAAPQPKQQPLFVGSLGMPFAQIRVFSNAAQNQCRFIEGDAPDYLCCANETEPGASYCGHHAQIVWTAPEKRRAVAMDGMRRGMKASSRFGSHEAV